jgi:hypothetical protein
MQVSFFLFLQKSSTNNRTYNKKKNLTVPVGLSRVQVMSNTTTGKKITKKSNASDSAIMTTNVNQPAGTTAVKVKGNYRQFQLVYKW